jgi:hypothetical protein
MTPLSKDGGQGFCKIAALAYFDKKELFSISTRQGPSP